MNGTKTRAALMGVVGAYLLYTAYELFQGRSDPDTTMTPAVMILFIVLFVAAGIGLLIYAWRLWRRGGREEADKESWDEQNGIKH